jgi:hypothetical protein
MNSRYKNFLGILTLFPLLGYALLFSVTQILSMEAYVNYLKNSLLLRYSDFILMAATALIGIGLMVFYISHVLKVNSVSSLMKIIWVLLIIFLNMVSMPIYFYLYIWKEPSTPATQDQR